MTLSDITGRKQAEEALRESEKKYRSILETIEEGYFEVDLSGNYTFFNDSMCRTLGYSSNELMGMNNRAFMDTENAQKVYNAFNQVFTSGQPLKNFDWELITKDGEKCYVDTSVSLIKNANGEAIGFRGIERDITTRKRAEEQKDSLVSDLQKALSEVKTLRGFIPICAHCKNIRNDKGYWEKIEKYIHEHSDAQFSHGICQECAKKYYPDFNIYEDE